MSQVGKQTIARVSNLNIDYYQSSRETHYSQGKQSKYRLLWVKKGKDYSQGKNLNIDYYESRRETDYSQGKNLNTDY